VLMKVTKPETFNPINAGYDAVFKPNHLSVGLVLPIESYPGGPVPTMEQHLERAQLAEELGFSAVWLRDVPFNVPTFGDAGHVFDPFVYLGALAACTSSIALGVASIVLPLRHPAHVAKTAASADQLSGGRLILGIASGDRPEEFPAMNMPFAKRGELFRESYDYIRQMSEPQPRFGNTCGCVSGGMDLLPKPVAGKLPLLVTGSSQQSPDWIAQYADGWMTYPRPVNQQAELIDDFRDRIEIAGVADKPVMEPLYLDLAADPDEPASPIHLGFRMGVNALGDYLESRRAIGVNHVALNLRFNRIDPEQTLRQLADTTLPVFF
jgi:luciferase-type oxidoreductase